VDDAAERYNAEWLIENQLGMVVKNWREVADAARQNAGCRGVGNLSGSGGDGGKSRRV
jgi:hypothetical protein